jgi:hypothetical protein
MLLKNQGPTTLFLISLTLLIHVDKGGMRVGHQVFSIAENVLFGSKFFFFLKKKMQFENVKKSVI